MVVRPGLAFVALLLASVTSGCRSPCGGVSGACMVITLDSAEPIDALELKLRVKDPIDGSERDVQPGGGALQRIGRSDKIRLLPPAGVDAAQITAISLLARRETGECFQYSYSPVTWGSGSHESLTATFQAPPRITALSPLQGPTSGGTPVDLQGENFVEGMQILWGNAGPVSAQLQNVRSARVPSQPVPAWTPGTPTKLAVRDPAGCQTNEASQGFQQYATPAQLGFSESFFPIKTATLDLNLNDAQFAYVNNDTRPDIIAASTVAGAEGYVTILFADEKWNYNLASSSNRCDVKVGKEPISIASGHIRWPQPVGEDIAVVHSGGERELIIIKPSAADPMNCSMIDISDKRTIKSWRDSGEKPNRVYIRDINNDNIDDILIINQRSSVINGFASDESHALTKISDVTVGTDNSIWAGLGFVDYNNNGLPGLIVSDYNPPNQLVLLKTTTSTDAQNHVTTFLTMKKAIALPDRSPSLYPWDVGFVANTLTKSTSLIFSRHPDGGLGIVKCGKDIESCPATPSEMEIQILPIGAVPAVSARRMVQADFDGNGSMDIAISHERSDEKGEIVVLLSDENGSLSQSFAKSIPTKCSLFRIDAHDMDADGKPDLIATAKGTNCGSGSVLVLRNISQ